MLKPVKWSSFADEDFAKLLEYLNQKWNVKVCNDFIIKLDYCINHIQKTQLNFR
jgi:plasmid stabilization system protein ParE